MKNSKASQRGSIKMAFTFFFRDLQVLELTVENILPYICGKSRIKIWDAGCAMGPEPYSMAILLAECMGPFQFRNVQIMASDHDEGGDFDKIIAEGIYPEEPLSRIPENLFKKYFSPAGKPGYFQISDLVKDRINFFKHDLLSYKEIGTDFSLILCKNVLLHLQPDERIEVIKMFHRALSPDGFFVTEQTQKLPGELSHLFRKKVSDAQLFQKIG
jgi:chemotaxis protein methyltransferase CheR